MSDAPEFDDPTIPEFASWLSYTRFVQSVRKSNRYVWDDKVRLFLETVVATITQRDTPIPMGSVLYRAQQGIDWERQYDEHGNHAGDQPYGYAASRMKPLKDRAREGRANPTGIPVLYVGKTVETAISEVRPWIGAEVSVARCAVVRPLRALDLSLGHASSLGFSHLDKLIHSIPFTAAEKKSCVWNDIDRAFSRPVTTSDNVADYAPTQILAEVFKRQGYDALLYKSQFGDEDGYNVAIFDPDAVEVLSCAPYEVKSIKVVAEQIGNDWYRSSPDDGGSVD